MNKPARILISIALAVPAVGAFGAVVLGFLSLLSAFFSWVGSFHIDWELAFYLTILGCVVLFAIVVFAGLIYETLGKSSEAKS